MPGPKPLAPKAFAAKHAHRLNYTLVEVLESRKFKVKCSACDLERVVNFSRSNGTKCSCTHKRKFYQIKRTPETHTKELHDLGYLEYTCTAVGKLSKDRNTYQHACGSEFTMTKDCFVGSKSPCAYCRVHPQYHTNETYVAKAASKGITPLEQFTDTRVKIKQRFDVCGHVYKLLPAAVTRDDRGVVRCRICHPTGIWFRGRAGGKRFRVRSRVEIAFLRRLVELGYDMNRVEYEPASGKVEYFHPIKKRTAVYTPDFKVNDTYVELKDMASLGLRHYNWIDKEQALIENRAKCKAATQLLGDYQTFVYHRGKFHRVHKFWTVAEQNRLRTL